MAAREHPNVSQYGAVRVADDRVVDLVEKPSGDDYRLINAGVYAMTQDCFDRLEATPRRDGDLILTDALLPAIEEAGVPAVHTDGVWVDATYPWDLLEVARRVLADGWVTEPQRAPDVYVDPTARVHEDATLQGPVVVGPDTEIAAGAVVGPDVAVGRNVTVGANATVDRSVLDADVRVGPGATLRDCVTGGAVVVGANAAVPGGLADVRVGDRVFPGERLGAVLADRAELGGGSTCEPGAMVGVNARVGVGAFVRDRVPDDGEVTR
jgi:glucose-1-phosphate thymidylyltransferase